LDRGGWDQSIGLREGDAQEKGGEKAEDGDGYQDRGGDGVKKVEATSDQDYDTEAADGGEGERWPADAE
jgi:hypothetical protein